MEYLHKSVRGTLLALSNLRIELDAARTPIRRGVRLNLDLHIQSLMMFEREVRKGLLSRRVWSLGQASIPALTITLKSIEKQAGGRELSAIAECRVTLSEFGDALEQFAENS